jgi:membrane protein YdbS with pleckstrin-like domain
MLNIVIFVALAIRNILMAMINVAQIFLRPNGINIYHVRFKVSTEVTTKNGVFWDVTPYGSSKNGRFGGT